MSLGLGAILGKNPYQSMEEVWLKKEQGGRFDGSGGVDESIDGTSGGGELWR